MTWQPIYTAPKDGQPITAAVDRLRWESGKEDGPVIAQVRWDGSRWVLAENFGQDADIVVSQWLAPD